MGDLYSKIIGIAIMWGIIVLVMRESWPNNPRVDSSWWADSFGALLIFGLVAFYGKDSIDTVVTALLIVTSLVMVIVVGNWLASYYRHYRDVR